MGTRAAYQAPQVYITESPIEAISAQPPEKVKVRVGYGYAPHSGSLQVCKKPTPLRANCTMILATVCAHLSGNIGPA